MPADLPEPESAATIIMGEYVIEMAEGELTSGSQVIRIDNIGAQPHFIGWFQLPDGTTGEQVQVVLDEEMQAEMSGTPAAYSDINPDEDLMPVGSSLPQGASPRPQSKIPGWLTTRWSGFGWRSRLTDRVHRSSWPMVRS